MSRDKKPTINDVARRAGVSKATVSAVLNDTGSVKDSTRDRVLEVVEQMNYRPSNTAGNIGKRRGKSIGLLIKELDNPYYAEVIAGARREANAHGYTLLVTSSEGEYAAEQRIVDLLKSKDVDGLIITPVLDAEPDLTYLFDLKRRNFPFVLLEGIRGVQASLVDIDNVAASHQAAAYLIEQGHSRLVHFAGPEYSMHSGQRIEGVRRAYSESRLIFTDEVVVPTGAHLEDGYRVGLEFFRRRRGEDRPTAALCYNDLVALGLYRALAELGIAVPDEVSIVGCDDIQLLDYLPVSMTTVHVPKVEMGQLATRMLIRHIEAPENIEPQKVYLDAELVVRGTTRSLNSDSQSAPALVVDGAQSAAGSDAE